MRGAVVLGLGVKKEARVEEDFWGIQKTGCMLSLVGSTEHAVAWKPGLTQNALVEKKHLAEDIFV